ncbi:MAG: hypothetical protein Q7V57_18625 [Actinomycetota bacterium]|nr:hypothetical protein [Actinomycetota bacterium]
MNWIVPRWALALLVGVALSSIVVGLLVEGTEWAADRPFTINLLSALAGFAASLTFASLVLNRIARRQYWSAELDRRTRATITLEAAARHLAGFFDLLPTRAIDVQLRELHKDLLRTEQEDAGCVNPVDPAVYSELSEAIHESSRLDERLAFVADGELIYRVDRLGRKWKAFEEAVEAGSYARVAQPPSAQLVISGVAVAEALVSVRRWVYEAPDRKMRSAVHAQAFRSDLD